MSDLASYFRIGWLNLREERGWRNFLILLFFFALICRFLVYTDLADHPVGTPEQWPGTVSWFYTQKAHEAVADEAWLMPGPTVLTNRERLSLIPARTWTERLDQWNALLGNRLPRGAVGAYIAALSIALTQSLVIYKLAALAIGAVVPVLMAMSGAILFGDRRAGAVAGIVATLHQSLVITAIIPGPWVWETAGFAVMLYAFARIRSEPSSRDSWVFMGLALGLGLLLRPVFLWGFPLLGLAMLRWRLRPGRNQLIGLLIPLLILGGGLAGRNIAAGSGAMPVVGAPAWDFVYTVHPGAVLRDELPADGSILILSEGSFWRAAIETLRTEPHRSDLPRVVQRKLRELVGARDVSDTLSFDYMRRRAEMLRLLTFSSDMTMAAGWAALVFLLLCRRLPNEIAIVVALLIVHGLLFRSTGPDRSLLHATAAMLIGGAFVDAWNSLRLRPSRAFAYIALWAAAHLALQIDDQARGSRFRPYEFVQAGNMLLREGRRDEAREEIADYDQIRRMERNFRLFWYERR